MGLILSFLSQGSSGSSWWLFAGFANFAGLIGLATALLVSLLLAALPRIRKAVFLLVVIDVGGVGILAWFAAKLLKTPFM